MMSAKAKILIDYEAFSEWLEKQERLEGKASDEWNGAFPGCEQALCRRGMAYAFREAGQALSRFVIEKEAGLT